MKVFTTVLIVSILAFPAFASGGGEADMMEKDSGMESESMDDGSMKEDPTVSMELIPPFPDFMDLESAAMKADSVPTVLFFYASWCPSCKAMARELKADPEKLDGINFLVVDYDDSDDLQKKYGVTYQHTFVLIDSAGEAVDVWNGGGVDDVLMRAKGM